MTFAGIKGAAAAVGEEFKRAADYVKHLAEDFAALRKTMQEVATLKGEGNTNEFTVAEAKKAYGFGLNPEENRDFQAEFMNYAGSQIATDEKTGEVAEGAKLSTKQGEEYAGRVAALMKESGIAPAVGAELAGSLLEQKTGPQDVDKLMAEFSKTFNILEKGRTPLSQALPQMSQIMAYGVSSEEAAKMFNVVAPASPKEPGVGVEAGFKAIQKMKNEGTGEEFGVKAGMSEYESAKAFGQNLSDRKKALTDAGKTEKEALDEIAKLLTEKELATEMREARGLVRGFGGQGIGSGAFATFEKIADETPEDFEAARKKRYEASDQGKENAAMNRQAVARAERGAEQQAVRLELEKSRGEVIESKELEEPSAALKLRGLVSNVSGVDVEQQLTNRRTLARLGREATDAGVENPYDDRTALGAANVAEKSTILPQLEVNKEIKELLTKIAESNAQIAASNQKMAEEKKDGGARQTSEQPNSRR